jgi:exopolysaccharide production protein ExoZ
MPDKLRNIQGLRAIAVLLVMLIHIQANELRSAGDALLSPWLYHGVAGVDLFFVISGFVMVWITQRGDRPIHIGHFLYSRATRVYPAVWLWTTVAIIGFVMSGTLQQWLEHSDLLFSYLLLPQSNAPLLGLSWTLIHELYFYLVFSALLLVPRRMLWIGLLVWAGFIWAGHAAGWADLNPNVRLIFHSLTLEFIAGAFIGLIVLRWSPPKPGLIALFGAAGMIAGALFLGEPDPGEYPKQWGRVLAFLPGASLLVLGCASLDRQNAWSMPGMLVQLGDWSYSLYLSHLIVIAAIAHVWTRFAQPGPWDNLLVIMVMAGAPIIVAMVGYYGFEHPVLQQTRRFGRQIFKPANQGSAAQP